MSESTEAPAGKEQVEAKDPSTPAQAPLTEKPEFTLKTGAEVEYGPRKGVVESVRGGAAGADNFYDVLIRWEDQKYPEWYLYVTLKKLYAQGEFDILNQGKRTFLERLRSLLRS